MSIYGEATVDVWAARSAVLTLANTPIPDSTEKLWAMVQGGAGSAAGVAQGLLKVQAGVVAWARFTYSAMRRVALVLLKSLLAGRQMTSRDAWQATMNTLYDLQGDYESIIVDRMEHACAGVRLMFGLDSPFALVLYHGCMTHSASLKSMYRTAVQMFVVVPMATCICRDAANQYVAQYAMETCVPRIPVSLVPTLFMIVRQAEGTLPRQMPKLRCAGVIGFVQAQLNSTMDPFFEHSLLAMDAASNLVDYLVSPFDSAAGQCRDLRSDPHVVVIVPNPADYFVRCAQTSICKVSPVHNLSRSARAQTSICKTMRVYYCSLHVQTAHRLSTKSSALASG
jgi:hypothetical protein